MTKDPYEFCELGGHTNEFYQRPEEDDRVYTSPETMSWLLKAELILECLMRHGVAHFEGYDAAMEDFNREWKK